jgi:hypothetical protein
MPVEYLKHFLAIVADALAANDDRPTRTQVPRPTWPRPCSARRRASAAMPARLSSGRPFGSGRLAKRAKF